MPSTYVHLSGRDLDDAILRLNGIKRKEENKEDDFVPKKCQRCKETNPPTSRFCTRCGSPLDQKTALQFEGQRKRMDNLMTHMLKDPTIRAAVVNKIREMRNKPNKRQDAVDPPGCAGLARAPGATGRAFFCTGAKRDAWAGRARSRV